LSAAAAAAAAATAAAGAREGECTYGYKPAIALLVGE